jgi:hypothetical protein
MPANKVSTGGIQANAADVTRFVELYDEIDLSDLTGIDTSIRTYTNLLSNNCKSSIGFLPCMVTNRST